MAAKEPEKKMPSTQAKATMRSAKEAEFELDQSKAHLAFLVTAGTVSMALNRRSLSSVSLMYVSIKREYISE